MSQPLPEAEPTAESSNGFDVVAQRLDRLRERWQSSLALRTMTIIAAATLLVIAVTGSLITNQVKNSLFEQTLSVNIEQFSTDASVAQDRFSVASSPTIAQSQRIALDVVSSMYDPSRGLLGGVLLRSPDQVITGQNIPVTATSNRIRGLVSEDLRDLIQSGEDLGWQSVKLTLSDGSKAPGMVIGTTLRIPGSGDYELYGAYSLENQESLLATTVRSLASSTIGLFAALTLISYIVMRLVLRPIREASASARLLAEGEFESRMTVRGSDEIAQLAMAFNQMASSLEEQFTRLQRMSGIQTNFVSAVSHELRSPVTTIRMAGQLIYEKRDELPPALKRSAELQHSQLLNLDTMLSDLLEISRYDAGGMSLATEVCDIAKIATDVIRMAEPLAVDNGVVVEFETTGETLARVEPRRIERIIRNLVVNALEHAEGLPVKVAVVGGRDAVAVRVMDNGVGLTPEHAEHVFDRFWRADASRVRKSGGTGLGLTIAREDALIHGGTLEATGELGVGSTFLLTIPLEPGEEFTPPLPLDVPPAHVAPGDDSAEHATGGDEA